MSSAPVRPASAPIGSARGARVLADGWYSWLADGSSEHPWEPLTEAVSGCGQRVSRRLLGHGFLRGLALALLSSRYGAVAMIRQDPGWRTLLLLRALCGRRRKLVAFQFFAHPPAGLGAYGWERVERWALRRSLALAQVLTDAEQAAYPAAFGIPAERFVLVRFPARTVPRGGPSPEWRGNGPVVAAGRAHCDWRTLFAAASARGWDLQVVCSAADRARVEHLNAVTRAGAQVSVELPHEQTHALLSRAAISVICLDEGLVGRGHIRLAEATDTGAAVVASDVASLAGYARDGETALLVAPGDPLALRVAVERLLRDRELRAELSANAFSAAAAWTGADYLAELQRLCAEVARGATPGGG